MEVEEQHMTKNAHDEHQRILVVYPHPDDEAFSVSGTLAKYIDSGAHVTYACLTLGRWDVIWAYRRLRTE